MRAKKKIAVVMELQFPYNRHFGTFAGIQQFAIDNPEWELNVSCFPHLAMASGIHFDGIIGRITPSCLNVAKAKNIPIVNVWSDSPVRKKISGVYLDMYAAGKMAAEHLVNRGFQELLHFGYIGAESHHEHYLGMLEVVKKNHFRCEHFLSEPKSGESEKLLQDHIKQIKEIQRKWKPPIGISFAQDEMAHITLNLMVEYGWRCPEDFAVVGTHDEELICNATNPTISSIKMADRRCGYEAAQMLDSIIEDPSQKISNIIIPPSEVVIRASSDSYALDDEVILKALRYMIENIKKKMSVSDIALAVGVGRQALERRFRKELKRTVNNELIRLRVSKMRRLLAGTDLSVGEIGYQSGFGTSANMNLMFKRHTSMSPVAYRKKHRSE